MRLTSYRKDLMRKQAGRYAQQIGISQCDTLAASFDDGIIHIIKGEWYRLKGVLYRLVIVSHSVCVSDRREHNESSN